MRGYDVWAFLVYVTIGCGFSGCILQNTENTVSRSTDTTTAATDASGSGPKSKRSPRIIHMRPRTEADRAAARLEKAVTVGGKLGGERAAEKEVKPPSQRLEIGPPMLSTKSSFEIVPDSIRSTGTAKVERFEARAWVSMEHSREQINAAIDAALTHVLATTGNKPLDMFFYRKGLDSLEATRGAFTVARAMHTPRASALRDGSKEKPRPRAKVDILDAYFQKRRGPHPVGSSVVLGQPSDEKVFLYKTYNCEVATAELRAGTSAEVIESHSMSTIAGDIFSYCVRTKTGASGWIVGHETFRPGDVSTKKGPTTDRSKLPAGAVVCDVFKVHAMRGPSGLLVRLETDLPDDTTVMVGSYRCYKQTGNLEDFCESYFSKRSTAKQWRKPRLIPIDNRAWRKKLKARKDLFDRFGEPFTIASISDSIRVNFTVPYSAFPRSNKLLFGTMVQLSHGRKVVRGGISICWPME